jgi:acyl-CoA thioester hydrolase
VPPFRYYLRVRYAECDAQKVVFNSRYAEYVDVALNEFLRAVGFDTARLIASGLDFQLVKQTIEWRSAARFDDVLEIAIETVRLGTTSFTCRATFRRPNADAILTTIETVYVLVEADTMKKTPLPARFRAAVEGGARGRIVDHAAHCDLGALDPPALAGPPRARSMGDDVIGPPEEANQK